MICSHCGKETTDDALFCSKCGMKFEQVETLQKDTNTGNQEQNNKEFIFYGRTWINQFLSRHIVSKIIKNSKEIDVTITCSRRKTKNFRLKASELKSTKIKFIPYFGIIDYIRVILFIFLAIGMFLIDANLLGVGFFIASMLFVWMAFTKAMVLELNNGVLISVPIINDYDVAEFYREIDVNTNCLNKNKSKSGLIFWVWLFVAAIIITMGTNAYSKGEQSEYIQTDESNLTYDNYVEKYTGDENTNRKTMNYAVREYDGEEYYDVSIGDIKENSDSFKMQNVYTYGMIFSIEDVSVEYGPVNGSKTILSIIIKEVGKDGKIEIILDEEETRIVGDTNGEIKIGDIIYVYGQMDGSNQIFYPIELGIWGE